MMQTAEALLHLMPPASAVATILYALVDKLL